MTNCLIVNYVILMSVTQTHAGMVESVGVPITTMVTLAAVLVHSLEQIVRHEVGHSMEK